MKRFVKAVVLDSRYYKGKLKRGSVVTLGLSTLEYTPAYDPLVKVVGSTWGTNLIRRFGLDPLAK